MFPTPPHYIYVLKYVDLKHLGLEDVGKIIGWIWYGWEEMVGG